MHQANHSQHQSPQPNEPEQQQIPSETKDLESGVSEPDLQKKLKTENPYQNLISKEDQVSSQVFRSREIHKRLQEKKSGWKPTEAELNVLKESYISGPYPSREEKERLLKLLEEKGGTKVNVNKLGRWFQRQRERNSKAGDNEMKKHTYKKFGKVELEFLQECFNKSTYPKKEEMMEIANKLGSTFSKIENWYKHTRRAMARKNLLSLKMKKYFKKNELEYLIKCFSMFPRPTKEKYQEIAKTLNCDEGQIKTWFSNQRKKRKNFAKRNGLSDSVDQMSAGNLLLLNLSMTENPNTFSESKIAVGGPQQNEAQGDKRATNGTSKTINASYTITTSHTAIPMLTTGAIPMTGAPKYIGPSTHTSISLPTSQMIPIAPNGMFPITTNETLQYQSNGSVPISTMIPNQGTLMQTNGFPIFTQAPTTIPQHVHHQPQFQQLRERHNIHHHHQNPIQQIRKNEPSQAQSSNNLPPQFHMIPLNQSLPQYNNPLLRNDSQKELPQIRDTQSSKFHLENGIPNFAKSPQQAHGRGSNFSNEFASNESVEPQASNRNLIQETNGNFSIKSIVNLVQPPGSTSDISGSKNNSSSNSSSTHSHQRHQHNHKNTNSHQISGTHRVSDPQSGNTVHQVNAATQGWIYQPQGGTMYIPIAQPFASTPTMISSQPQVSYYFTVAPSWQNSGLNYGPTYQNNSYIYNNSTTYANYNNGHPTQSNAGFNSGTVLPYAVNMFTGQPTQAQSSFENAEQQITLQQRGSTTSESPTPTQIKSNGN